MDGYILDGYNLDGYDMCIYVILPSAFALI